MAVIPECVAANFNQAFLAVRSNTPDGLNCDIVTLITEVRRTEWSADFSVLDARFPAPIMQNQTRAKIMMQNALSSRGRITTCDVVVMQIPSGLISKWRVGYLPPTKEVSTSDEDFPEVINDIPPSDDDRKKARHNTNRLKKGKTYRSRSGSIYKTEPAKRTYDPAQVSDAKTKKSLPTMVFYNSNIKTFPDPKPTRSQKNKLFAWLRINFKKCGKGIIDKISGRASTSSCGHEVKAGSYLIQPFVKGKTEFTKDLDSVHNVDITTKTLILQEKTISTRIGSATSSAEMTAISTSNSSISDGSLPTFSYTYSDFDITVGRLSRDPLVPAALYDLTHCPCRYNPSTILSEHGACRRVASMAIIDRHGLHNCVDDYEKLLAGIVERTRFTVQRLETMPLPATSRNGICGKPLHLYCYQSQYRG